MPHAGKSSATLRSSSGKWILAASVLGSGAVFLEGSVVSVALPAIGRDFHLAISGLQWVMNGYLLMLSALMLFGGALGDKFSRPRVFGIGLVGFAGGSIACSLAPNLLILVAARLIQGTAGALVVPNSLALLETTFSGEEQGIAVGRWAAWSAVSTAAGPLLGGWLVDAASWRFVFVSVVPFALASAWIAFSQADVSREKLKTPAQAQDYAGTALITLALAAIVASLIAGPAAGFGSAWILSGFAAAALLAAAFIFVERRAENPMLPLDIFRSRDFVGANANTLLVYGALNALFFVLMLQLQYGMGYSALKAGASLLPINALLLVLSPLFGKLAERIGPRMPIAGGSVIAAAGMALFARIHDGSSYFRDVLPPVIVFGIGLGILVAPLTAVALRSLGDRRAGIASGVNNAVARLAGLLATAGIPVAAELGAGTGSAPQLGGERLAAGFTRAMLISAALCALGAIVAFTVIAPERRKIPH